MPRSRNRSTQQHPQQGQRELPVQPVDKPILCSPYQEPAEYWVYDTQTGEANRAPGRRPAGYYYRTERTDTSQQMRLFAEENWEELPWVNALREDVKRWRASNYEGATNVTRELLHYWWREDRYRRLFYSQLEAAETAIFLSEIRAGGKRVRFNPRSLSE